jgi:plasmid stabilization system protein ParE
MDFRVELSDQAQSDIAGIHEWLRSRHAGDAGERWFAALRAAIGSLTRHPSRCPLAPEDPSFPLKYVNCYTVSDRTFIASSSRSKETL